jgi:HSF-type DNA-binding
MLMLIYIDREGPENAGNCAGNHCISWVHDGRAFIIRNKDELVQTFLPIFFRQSKFPSFTRKLYRWGFRQISISQDHVSGSRRQMIFGHEFFQRDNKSLMSRMRSTTAAGTRRAMQAMTLKQRERSEATVKLSIQSKIDEHGGTLSLQHLTPIYPAPERIATTPLSHLNSQYFSIGHLSSSIKFQQNNILQYPCQEGQKIALNIQEPDSAESHQLSSTRINNKYEGISRTEDSKIGQLLPDNNSEASLLPNVSSTRLQEQVTNVNVENQRESESDPNAYMRAAVDLLLRYAS